MGVVKAKIHVVMALSSPITLFTYFWFVFFFLFFFLVGYVAMNRLVIDQGRHVIDQGRHSAQL